MWPQAQVYPFGMCHVASQVSWQLITVVLLCVSCQCALQAVLLWSTIRCKLHL